MFEARLVHRGRSSTARPGENKTLLCTAPNEKVAGMITRSLGIHQIECSARHHRMREVRAPGEIPRPVRVDLHVRGSDLERARRIVGRFSGIDARRSRSG